MKYFCLEVIAYVRLGLDRQESITAELCRNHVHYPVIRHTTAINAQMRLWKGSHVRNVVELRQRPPGYAMVNRTSCKTCFKLVNLLYVIVTLFEYFLWKCVRH